jgi:hypothetical protein
VPADDEAQSIELSVAVRAWRARLEHFRAYPDEIERLLNEPMQLVLRTEAF